jgi:hypothetical protein
MIFDVDLFFSRHFSITLKKPQMDLFQKKRKQIEEDYKKRRAILEWSKCYQFAKLEDIKTLYQRFHHRMSQWRIERLLDGEGCLLCHENTRLQDFSKGHIIEDRLYCDQHGDLLLEHRPIHKQGVVGCKDCAILECSFRNPEHNIELGDHGCEECRGIY